MGKKNPLGNVDYDDSLFSEELDIDAFEQEHFEKNSRRRGGRKARRQQAARNRFSDYEEERFLKRHARDWEDYDTIYDDEDFVESYYASLD